MCHRLRCRQCGKPTWAGCGAHIEQALAGVPRDARCQGHNTGGKEAGAPSPAPRPRRFLGLF